MPETKKRRRRREQSSVLRTNDYPIDPPGGRAYLLKGVEAELFEQFKQTCAAQQRSMRWVLLSLMHEYVKGTVKT